MDAFAKSRWSPVALAAVVLSWSVGPSVAAPPARRGDPGRLVARAAVAKHNSLRERQADDFEAVPLPANDLPADDLPIEDEPGAAMFADEPLAAGPPVRRGAPGRLIARAAVAQHNAFQDRQADESEVVPAEALQPAEEFFPDPDMPVDEPPVDEPPVAEPSEDLPSGDMPAGDEPDDVAPLEPVPAEAAPYAATPLLDDYPLVEPGPSDYYDPNECDSCGDDCCGHGCGDCVDSCSGGGCRCGSSCGCSGLTAGVEFTFVKPRFSRNVAFTILDSDGDTFETFTEIEFDYAFDLALRGWLGYAVGGGYGWRATYWQYDEEAETASSSPPPNGFGAIIPPEFGDVDIGTAIPTDVFTANSRLNAYTIDLEATQETTRGAWVTGASYGVRFASMQQDYLARTRNAAGTLLGQIDYYRTQRGAGPTVALTAGRSVTNTVTLFGMARGSVLFGDTDANFFGGEDQDIAAAFNTFRVTTRDDVWTIGEAQVGLRWVGRRSPRGGWQPFASGAAEGQSWNDAGNATSEDGTLGFVGFNIGIGVLR